MLLFFHLPFKIPFSQLGICALIFLSILLSISPANGQYVVEGTVIDKSTSMGIPGAHIVVNDTPGAITDINGSYKVIIENRGPCKITFTCLGYEPFSKVLSVGDKKNYLLSVSLKESAMELHRVVVTAGRYEQPLNEVTVSMDVIKQKLIEDMSPTTMEEVLDQVPGVNLIKTQVNIRGGSGWSYGAGSRVMLLVDGLPMLAADSKDIKWTALPLYSADQVEVIKGASSALYGSAALDGIINIRTYSPRSKPVTKATIYGGFYDDPKNSSFKYWDDPPIFKRVQWMDARKIKNLDLLISGDFSATDGYRQGEDGQLSKAFIKLEHHIKKVRGLSYGANITLLSQTGGNFLYWENAENPFIPDSGTISRQHNTRFVLDPFIKYRTHNNSIHSLKGRIFNTKNINNTSQGSFGQVVYGEYQYLKRFSITKKYEVSWTHGLVVNYSNISSPDFYGSHHENDYAIYGQLNQKVGKVNISLGSRLESYQIDTFKRKLHPIFRSGLVVQVAKVSFVRASFGQGIRFPSVAEKFAETTSGSVIIFPNKDLQPEKGWNAEIGIKQGYAFSSISGFVDLAGFWTEYKNMIEFEFGNYNPPFGFGFKANNVTDARISGVEVSAMGKVQLKPIVIRYFAGYDFITPVDMNYSPASTDTLGSEKFLKYRYRHLVKASSDITYKFVTIGAHLRYNSFMLNIDNELNYIAEGTKKYREENNEGDMVMDAFLSFKIHKYLKAGCYVKNVLNEEYMYLPGNMGPPRNFIFKLSFEL